MSELPPDKYVKTTNPQIGDDVCFVGVKYTSGISAVSAKGRVIQKGGLTPLWQFGKVVDLFEETVTVFTGDTKYSVNKENIYIKCEASLTSDSSYIPSPSADNSSQASKFFGSSRLTHDSYMFSETKNVYLEKDFRGRYAIPETDNLYQESKYIVPPEDAITYKPPEQENFSFMRKYLSIVMDFITNIKLHVSWKRLVWSPENAYKFPSKFKERVQIFVYGFRNNPRKLQAMFHVFRYISQHMKLFEN